jgi:uncharacterized protein (DUF885 family)
MEKRWSNLRFMSEEVLINIYIESEFCYANIHKFLNIAGYSMKILKTVSFSSLMLLGALSSCSKIEPPSQDVREDVTKEFRGIVNDYFESYLQLDPLFATSIGDHRFDDKMAISISSAERESLKALIQSSLDKVKKIPSEDLNEQDKLTYEMFLDDLQSQQQLLMVGLDHLMPFNQFSSFFSNFAELSSGSSYITFNTALDYENFLKRADVVPEYIDVMIENMKVGIARDVTTPKILVELGLKQLKALLVSDYKESIFYKPLLTIEDKVPGEEGRKIKNRYDLMIKNVIYPAYEKLERFVEEEYLSKARTTDGLCEVPGGRAFYLALIKGYTTTELNPDQIGDLGLKEVARIKGEFEKVKEQMGFKGDLKAFYDSLKEKTPKLYPFHTAEEVLEKYQEIYNEVMMKVPEYFHLMPKAKFEVRRVDKFKESEAVASYQNPSEDGLRPGIFWVPIPNPNQYTAKDMEALFLHEAIPGHHFQISIQQELPGLLPYRKFMGNTAYIEGWALYAESLGKELGLYKDPYQWIGRLTLEMHRAIRLVVDTGIHWLGWSREKAIQYCLENEPVDLFDITAEVNRYMVIAGQAVSYKVGELKIQHLKQRSKDVLGSKYLDWEFNDEIIKNGSLPLSVLDAQVDRFIAEKLREK